MTAPTRRRGVHIGFAVLAYVVGIAGANVLSDRWPAVEVLALTVPAGTVLAGFVLTLRDLVHDVAGGRAAAFAVLAGAGLAWVCASPQIAVASTVAFTVSELADAAIYTVARTRSRLLAVGFSNLAGLVIDSLLFVPMAFGTSAALAGQLVGKTVATAASLCVLAALRKRRVAS